MDFEHLIGQFLAFSNKSVPNECDPSIVQLTLAQKNALSGNPLYQPIAYCSNIYSTVSNWNGQPCVTFFFRYNDTWGDWHGGSGGSLSSFESVIFRPSGTKNNFKDSISVVIESLEFKGMNGKTYGPYGPSTGEKWESKIPLECSVSYISGCVGDRLDQISFHHLCPNNQGNVYLQWLTTAIIIFELI